ncbi:MAG: triose-phosphate isomerase [Nitrososphaerota archaeon]|nr:triose-phosphate isomerase [Nitrososphaerota archaeon]MDG7021017.1 triose-phosphate isomerase [Nitrososphaerota archaeon]
MLSKTLIVNFKNYPEVMGEGSVRLAKAVASLSWELGIDVVVAPPTPMLHTVASAVRIPVFAQRVDLGEQGKSTGATIPESVKAAGCSGSLLNHSESRVPVEVVGATISRMKGLGLTTCACAETTEEAVRLASLGPEFIAIEPPELIGTGRAVSKARPGLLTETSEALARVGYKGALLCGAGIVSAEDVSAAIRLGTRGILVASSVVKADDWTSKLRELGEAMRG